MKIFKQTNSHLFCGHWNGSPLEIGLTDLITEVPTGEIYHLHDFREYYLVLEGKGALLVEGSRVPLEAGSLIMVEPGEKHRVLELDAANGIRWVIIKERSEPKSKILASGERLV